jgi:hypothetical protein
MTARSRLPLPIEPCYLTSCAHPFCLEMKRALLAHSSNYPPMNLDQQSPEREVIKALIFVATKVPFLQTRAIPKLS